MKMPSVRFLLADGRRRLARPSWPVCWSANSSSVAWLNECSIVSPANLTFQWQRELKEKFDQQFFVLKGGDIREQFGVNQWLSQKQVITSLDLAKREDILPGATPRFNWDLVIVDEAHRMSAQRRDPQKYALSSGRVAPRQCGQRVAPDGHSSQG